MIGQSPVKRSVLIPLPQRRSGSCVVEHDGDDADDVERPGTLTDETTATERRRTTAFNAMDGVVEPPQYSRLMTNCDLDR